MRGFRYYLFIPAPYEFPRVFFSRNFATANNEAKCGLDLYLDEKSDVNKILFFFYNSKSILILDRESRQVERNYEYSGK